MASEIVATVSLNVSKGGVTANLSKQSVLDLTNTAAEHVAGTMVVPITTAVVIPKAAITAKEGIFCGINIGTKTIFISPDGTDESRPIKSGECTLFRCAASENIYVVSADVAVTSMIQYLWLAD